MHLTQPVLSISKLSQHSPHREAPYCPPPEKGAVPDTQQAPWASVCKAQEKDAEEDDSCSAGLFLTNGPVTLPID